MDLQTNYIKKIILFKLKPEQSPIIFIQIPKYIIRTKQTHEL